MYKRGKPKFSIAHKDEEMVELLNRTDQKILAIWGIECARRVLRFFKEEKITDNRPELALKTLEKWIETGEFRMAVIRKASLDSHAAAREAKEDGPARSAARACGQAVATAHVPRHAYGAAIYAQQALFRSNTENPILAATTERNWQLQKLINLRNVIHEK